MGIPGRSGPSAGQVVFLSAFTAGLVAAGTVIGLLRFGSPILTGLVPPATPSEDVAAPALVPDLVGLRLEAADELLTGRGLRLVVQARRVGPEPAGTVTEQQPLGHSRVDLGAPVAVVVSNGSDEVRVPALVGKSLGEARAALEAVGLSVGPVSEASDGAQGTVVGTVPEPGTDLPRDSPVALSVGPASRVELPRLIGLNRQLAIERLEKLGLEVGKVSEIYDHRRRGNLVLEQDPAPKSEVEQGSAVDLIVNQGD